MIAPLYRARIDWGNSASAARVDIAHVDGPETIYTGTAAALFDGLFDNTYADVTDEVTAGKIQRKVGADGIAEGTLDLTITDSWPGKYNAKNPDSPLYGLILPGSRCEVDVSFDGGSTWLPIYGGWLNESESEPDYGKSEARINFTDLAYLSRPCGAIASTGPTTVAAALDLIHDAIGWEGDRDFRSDQQLSDFSTDGTGTARDAVAALIKVDLGYYYVSCDSVATYVDRYEWARRSSDGTFQAMGESVPGVALSTIVNVATATGPSGTPQTVEDLVSKRLYGTLADQAGDVSSDWFFNDAAALANATWRVLTQKDPVAPYWQFQPVPEDDATLQAAVTAELLDVLTIAPVGLPSEDQQALWIVHDFGGGAPHAMTWRLRELPGYVPFIVGISKVDSDAVIAV